MSNYLINDLSPKEKMQRARAGLILNQPFYGAMALRLPIVEDKAVPIMCTDGRRIKYNPQWVGDNPIDKIKSIVTEEVLHVILKHHLRIGDRPIKKANIAADYVCTSLVAQAGFEVCEHSYYNPQYGSDYSFERVYDEVFGDDEEQDDEGQDGDGEGGEGDESGDGQKPMSGGGIEKPKNDDGSDLSPDELEQEEQAIDQAVVQAFNMAKSQGNAPAGMERHVQELLKPKVDWRDVLRHFIGELCKDDYAWFPSNRRHIYQGLYLPSARSDTLGRIVVAIDTSGSISQRDLDEFVSELTAILEIYDVELDVIMCDTRIGWSGHFGKHEEVKLSIRGGGGTNFRPPFEFVENKQIEPVCFLYFTDLYCSSYPDSAPSYPVLWIWKNEGAESPPYQGPPFGEVIKMDD